MKGINGRAQYRQRGVFPGLNVTALASAVLLAGASVSAGAAQQVKDINVGSRSASPQEMTEYNGLVYFRADDNINGDEVWVSDGTDAGTTLLKDINPGFHGSDPYGFTVFNNLLYFVADDGTSGQELWVTDGTSAGTVLVQDINPGSGDASPSHLYVSGDKLFFQADDGSTGAELWTLDGLAACDFPLDASQTEVSQAGLSGKLTASNGDQTGSYTVQSGLASSQQWAMFPTGALAGTAQTLDVSTGIVGIAFNPDAIAESDGGNTIYRLQFSEPLSAVVAASLTISHSDGVGAAQGYHVYVEANNGASGSFLVSGVATKPNQIGLYFDASTGMFGASIDGVDYGPQLSFGTATQLVPVMLVSEGAGQSAGRQGTLFEGTFVTDAADITAAMPAGAVDACGNTL